MTRLRRILTAEAVRPVWLILFILFLWEAAVSVLGIPAYLVPPPLEVVKQLYIQAPELWRQSLVTLYATLGGFALSAVFGVVAAVAIVNSRFVETMVYPVLVFSQSIPKVAIAPWFVVWFGFGILPKIVVAFLLGFFPVIVSTVMGLKSVETDMLDLARSMKASKLQIFWKISLPQALPSIFSGLKVSVTLAVVGAVVGEFVGSNSGIGYVLQVANGNFDLPTMFAGLFILSMIGVVLFAAIDLIERFAVPWHVSRRLDIAPV
jgi:NitT/TauT family transport system permease protein